VFDERRYSLAQLTAGRTDDAIMEDVILLGIDGTGDLNDGKYYSEMRNSFVSYIVRRSPAKWKKYMRGPAFDGLDMGLLVGKGYEFVHLTKVAHPEAKVLLTGYSRGGAGIIAVAAQLAKDDVRVHGMVLFDPVDRSPTCETDEIPTNVVKVYTVRRMVDTLSRASFNNTGRISNPPTISRSDRVWGTHGALGGVPWKASHGERPNDWISEGASERTLTFAVYSVARIPWIADNDDHRTQQQFLAYRDAAGDHTRVTFHQDSIAARQTWERARPRLVEMGFLHE
jgi:hypothetical protein